MKRHSLLILGAGGHSKVVIETALAENKYQAIALLDDIYQIDNSLSSRKILDFPILGNLKKALTKDIKNKYSHAFVAIGDCNKRLDWLNILQKNSFEIPKLIHPHAFISPSAIIKKGSIVAVNSSIQSSVLIDEGSIINTGATVDHDCKIGLGSHICPGVNLAGNVNIGPKSWIGIGSCVIENIKIGREVIVGAGSTVVNDLPDNVKAYGCPARYL